MKVSDLQVGIVYLWKPGKKHRLGDSQEARCLKYVGYDRRYAAQKRYCEFLICDSSSHFVVLSAAMIGSQLLAEAPLLLQMKYGGSYVKPTI